MGTNLDRAKDHKVFPAKLDGGTLVVTPQGDAVGFREHDINSELKRVLDLLDQPEVSSLVVDLGSSTYFGTVVIGALTTLGQKCRSRGGRALLCDVSDEMLDVLRVMKLSDLWPKYKSLRDAVEAARRSSTA